MLGSHKYSKEFLNIWDTKRNNSYEKWVFVDEYKLIDDQNMRIGKDGKPEQQKVQSMQIISTHFEESEAKIKILFMFTDRYSIMDVIIKVSSFREFIVEIFKYSTKKYGFSLEKVWCNSTSTGNKFHIFAKVETDRNPSYTNTLMKIELDEHEKNDTFTVMWTSDTLKSHNIRNILGSNYLGVINDDEGVVYIFDLIEEKYSGFIDLNKVLPDIQSNS